MSANDGHLSMAEDHQTRLRACYYNSLMTNACIFHFSIQWRGNVGHCSSRFPGSGVYSRKTQHLCIARTDEVAPSSPSRAVSWRVDTRATHDPASFPRDAVVPLVRRAFSTTAAGMQTAGDCPVAPLLGLVAHPSGLETLPVPVVALAVTQVAVDTGDIPFPGAWGLRARGDPSRGWVAVRSRGEFGDGR